MSCQASRLGKNGIPTGLGVAGSVVDGMDDNGDTPDGIYEAASANGLKDRARGIAMYESSLDPDDPCFFAVPVAWGIDNLGGGIMDRGNL